MFECTVSKNEAHIHLSDQYASLLSISGNDFVCLFDYTWNIWGPRPRWWRWWTFFVLPYSNDVFHEFCCDVCSIVPHFKCLRYPGGCPAIIIWAISASVRLLLYLRCPRAHDILTLMTSSHVWRRRTPVVTHCISVTSVRLVPKRDLPAEGRYGHFCKNTRAYDDHHTKRWVSVCVHGSQGGNAICKGLVMLFFLLLSVLTGIELRN